MVSKYYHSIFSSFHFVFVGLNLFLLVIIVNKLDENVTMEEMSDADFEQNNWHSGSEVVDMGGFEYWVSLVGSWYWGMRFQLSYRDYEFSSGSDKMLLVHSFFVLSFVLVQFLFGFYFRSKTGPLQAVQLWKKGEIR